MFCKNCGKELPDGAKFCGQCGTPVISEDQEESEETATPEEQKGYGEPITSEAQTESFTSETSQKKKRKRILIPVILVAAVVVVVIVILFAGGGSETRQYQNYMEAGQVYLNEGSYKEAVAEFTEAIEVAPNEVDPYVLMAEAYLGLSDTDGVEETYDAARTMIMSSYEDSNELPEGAAELYDDAIDYYIETGNIEGVIKATDEIAKIGFDEEPQDFIDKGQTLIKESAKEVLSLFSYWTYDSLYAWYEESDDDLLDFEEIDAAQVFYLAAEVSLEPEQDSSEYFMDWDSSYYYSDGDMVADNAGFYNYSTLYGLLSTDAYEEHIVNMFGSQYDLEDFEEYQSLSGVKVRRDSAGAFYLQQGGDWGEEVVTVTVEDVSDSDEEGAFEVLAKYTASFFEGEEDVCYMWVRMMPDAGSAYGCVVTGMIPAGYGEIDENYLQNFDDRKEAHVDIPEWQVLYTDYLENKTWENDDPEIAFFLIELNEDDVPEILCHGSYNASGSYLFYIQNGQVKEKWMNVFPIFAEKEGYIYDSYSRMGETTDQVYCLNLDGELEVKFDGSYLFDVDTGNESSANVNGQSVTMEQYEEMLKNATSWLDGGEYNILTVDEKLDDEMRTEMYVEKLGASSDEAYISPFAVGIIDAIEKLRSGI